MNIKKVKIKKVKIEPMTITQFKSKLEGIEMFQDENWVPSKEQWELIKEMIDNIIDHNEDNINNNKSHVYQQPQIYQPPQVYHQPQSYPLQNGKQQLNSSINNIIPPNITNDDTNLEISQSGQSINSQKLIGKMNPDGTYESTFV